MGVPGKPNNVMVRREVEAWFAFAYDFAASVYRLPLQSPAAAAKEVKARALDLEPILEDIHVKHPLVRRIS
jgi:hypothetical protein